MPGIVVHVAPPSSDRCVRTISCKSSPLVARFSAQKDDTHWIADSLLDPPPPRSVNGVVTTLRKPVRATSHHWIPLYGPTDGSVSSIVAAKLAADTAPRCSTFGFLSGRA